jgi:hypothetical protein
MPFLNKKKGGHRQNGSCRAYERPCSYASIIACNLQIVNTFLGKKSNFASFLKKISKTP